MPMIAFRNDTLNLTECVVHLEMDLVSNLTLVVYKMDLICCNQARGLSFQINELVTETTSVYQIVGQALGAC